MRTNKTETASLLRPGDAAELLGITPRTLLRMSDRGDLPSVELPSGHRRYRRADVEALLQP